MFGISTCEIPEPWSIDKGEEIIQNFGTGGHNQRGNDGFEDFGYTVICPHYAGMVMADYPKHVPTFGRLLELRYLTPMNVVESIAAGTDEEGEEELFWNHHKRAWSLALTSLGTARALSRGRYLPHRTLPEVPFLRGGYEEFFPRSEL